MKRTGFILFITLLLGYMLLFPAESLNASVQGITLWFRTLLPALLPFIILSGLLIHTNFIPFFIRHLSVILAYDTRSVPIRRLCIRTRNLLRLSDGRQTHR